MQHLEKIYEEGLAQRRLQQQQQQDLVEKNKPIIIKKLVHGETGRVKKHAMIFVSLLVILVCLQSGQVTHRSLSINLGGGKCRWTPPEVMNVTNPLNTTTLLASYPGSGKRLTWRILEALTGKVSGDDWDLSENGYDSVLTMKTSYPHPEGIWLWDAHMDQVILLVRNPRYAIPSYHTMRYELNFSMTYDQSYRRKNFTYTERAPIPSWEKWRDARFEAEIERWVDYIEFWMQDGLKKDLEQDYHCFHNYLNCTPKAVIQFENLISLNTAVGHAEMTKLGSVLDSSENVNAIEPEARPCVYNQVIAKKELFNKNRDGKGPAPELKTFTTAQLGEMKTQIETLRDKYSADPWTDDPKAVDLVAALNYYIDEVEAEYDLQVLDDLAQSE